MPIHRRLPKRGFKNISRIEFSEINFDKIEKLIIDKKIDPSKIIDAKKLLELGIIKKLNEKIKLLAKGELKNKINIASDLIYICKRKCRKKWWCN